MKITYDIHGAHGCLPVGIADEQEATEYFDMMLYGSMPGTSLTLVRLQDGDVVETLYTKTKAEVPLDET